MDTPQSPDGTDAADLLARWQSHHERGDAPRHVGDGPVDAAPDPGTPRGGSRRAHAVDAAREIVSAVHDEEVPPTQPPGSKPHAAAEHRAVDPVVTGRTTNVTFTPKLLVRRVIGVLLLAALAATVVTGLLAYQSPGTLRVGVAGVLAVLTVTLWGIRVATPATYLSIAQGQLEYRRGSVRQVVDLSSRYTPVEVRGRAGRPGWRVLIGRFNAPPLVIDRSVVDPRAFSEALRRFRPDL